MIKSCFLIVVALCVSVSALAIPESNYAANWTSEVAPFIQAHGYYNTFQGVDGKRINYALFKNAPGSPTLVIVSGRTDAYLKYSEFIYDLYARGFSVFTFDHRGQGLSERLITDPEVGYVKYFKDYVSDLTTFMKIVKAQATGPIHLYGHSMGGAITTLYMSGHPQGVCSTILSSAMFEAYTNPYPYPIAIAYLVLLNSFGRGKDYAPGQGPYVASTSLETMTHSQVRSEKLMEIAAENPNIILGGASTRWALVSVPAGHHAETLAKKISTPLMVFQGGTDTVVDPKGAKTFCAAASDCRLKFYPESDHVIWAESDSIRDDYLASITSFIKDQNNACGAKVLNK